MQLKWDKLNQHDWEKKKKNQGKIHAPLSNDFGFDFRTPPLDMPSSNTAISDHCFVVGTGVDLEGNTSTREIC